MPFKRILTDSKGYRKKSYRSSERACSDCPLRAECCGKVTKFKKIEDSIHKPLYDEMHEKLRRDPNYTRFLTKRRSSRVEPVLGTLINHHNMKRINSRGMSQANKHVLMAALTYNLKKYLKFITRKIHRNIQPSDPQRVLRACVAIASAAAQIHSRASRGAKSPLRPKRTIARSSQRML